MFSKKRSKKSIEESLLDYASGNISRAERRRVEEYLRNNPDKSHLLANLLRLVHLPPSQQEKEWIESSTQLTPEKQAERLVAYYQKSHSDSNFNRIRIWFSFIEQKLAFWNRTGSKKRHIALAMIVLGIGILGLSLIGNKLYQHFQNLNAKNALIAEIKPDRVPRSLFLRPAGQNLEPDIFSTQLGQEEMPLSDSALSQVVSKNLSDADFLTRIAQYYLFNYEFEMAESYYKKALRVSKNNTLILNDLAIICYTREDFWYAYQLLEKAHNQEPKRIEIIYNLALVAQVLGKSDKTLFWRSEFERLNTSPAWAAMLKEKFEFLE